MNPANGAIFDSGSSESDKTAMMIGEEPNLSSPRRESVTSSTAFNSTMSPVLTVVFPSFEIR